MSATAMLGDPKTGKPSANEEFKRTPFPPGIFDPWKVHLEVDLGDSRPPDLPVRFQVVPTVENGNINLSICDVQYETAPEHPRVWTVFNATKSVPKRSALLKSALTKSAPTENDEGGVSVSLQNSLGDLLVLTGDSSGGSWNSSISNAHGKWTAKRQKCEYRSFTSRFSWTFLLAPPGDKEQTVILGFKISVLHGRGILQQTSSFPPGWVASNFGDLGFGGIFMTLTCHDETYNLQNGLFVGGLGALVCQGGIPNDAEGHSKAIKNPNAAKGNSLHSEATGASPFANGTWTGTSNGSSGG